LNKGLRLSVLAVLLILAFQPYPLAVAATSTVPSQASALLVSMLPPKLPSDGGRYPAVVVSLVDSTGLPTAAVANLTVFLASSQTNIASVPDSVTIRSGQEYVVVNATTTTTPGTTMITAHSEGLVSPSPTPLTTVTPSGFPSKLVVYASPATFLEGASNGVVRVEVVDEANLPSKAISSISVLLSSSNATIASLVQTTLTIPAGSIFVDGSFQIGSVSSTGSAVISATATGYSTGTSLVTVVSPGICLTGCGPFKLSMRLVPGTLPADGLSYSVLEVGLQTSAGTPAKSSSDTIVQLTSDRSEVASVQGLMTIPAGSVAALTWVTTSALPGRANITATSIGLVPATVSVTSVIPAPSKLQAYVAPPSSAYSTNGNYPILVVQLQDSLGNPARARQDVQITVTSSNGSLLSTFFLLRIPQGQDYVSSYLHVKGVGQSVLTSTTQGLSSSQVALKTVPSPLLVTLSISSTSNPYIYENQTALFTFGASFVGLPLQNMNVSWTSSGGVMSPPLGNTGTSGSTSSQFTPKSFGLYNITATAHSPAVGFLSITKRLTVFQVPPKPTPSLLEQIIGYWYYLAAAAAVAVIAVVYLLRMRRKKQRAEIEAGFEVV
jgi:hypothetical protein